MTQATPIVLIVDDDPDMCWVLRTVLEPEGCRVESVLRGSEALALLSRHTVGLMFIDAKLPDMEGLHLCALLREQGLQTIAILVSGYFYRDDPIVRKSVESGTIATFLEKPFDIQEVRRLVRRILRGEPVHAPQRSTHHGPHR
ncbi:MAG: response regulator [Candidatus Tectomicrobia bacterium]|nr:response regulator [Candidatus Tectomicrobia bacterium]